MTFDRLHRAITMAAALVGLAVLWLSGELPAVVVAGAAAAMVERREMQVRANPLPGVLVDNTLAALQELRELPGGRLGQAGPAARADLGLLEAEHAAGRRVHRMDLARR